MNNSNLDQIIKDLLELDPSLDEGQLRVVVSQLLSSKPNVVIDEAFKANLFARIKQEIKLAREPETINTFSFMKKFNFMLAGGAIVAVVALVLVNSPKSSVISLPGNEEITRMSANAFGPLTDVAGLNARNQSGGGGGNASMLAEMDKVAAPTAEPGFGGGSSDMAILPYTPTFYRYTYAGEPFTVEEPMLKVYQRIKGFGGNVDLQSFLQRFNAGAFSIDKFAGAKLEYVRVAQDTKYGYALNLDLKEGAINIDQNWEQWQDAYPICQDDACYQRTRIKESDMPSDEDAISMANQFLDEYGINRSNYGEPYVQAFWRMELARSVDRSLIYLPDVTTVVYPLKIEGNEIYDEGGNKTGVYVNINVRIDRVSNVGSLNDLRFGSSDYAAEQDSSRIISVAERGGYYGYMPLAEDLAGSTVTELQLGTPQRIYTRFWKNVNNQSQELYIPSLMFPIIDPPADLYQKSITVPLVKDILDSQPYTDGPVRIMQ